MEAGAVGVPGPPAPTERALELASVIILRQDLMADPAREKALKNGPVKEGNSYAPQNQVSRSLNVLLQFRINAQPTFGAFQRSS